MMVLYVYFRHLYPYPFETVARCYFDKYNSGKDPNVQSITLEEKRSDPENGVEIIKRKGECANVVPWIFRKILGNSSIFFEERAEINAKERTLRLHTRNLSWSGYVRLEEESVFKSTEDNSEWTVFEQRGTIDGFGLGPLASLGERLAKAFLIRGGNKGIRIMNELIKDAIKRNKGVDTRDLPLFQSETKCEA